MAVKIKLKRFGKMRAPYYRVVVADARTRRDGRAIEEIGLYHPKEDPSRIEVDSERVQHWLSVGAQPTEPVLALLKKTGDWQRFRGEPAPPPLLQAAPRPDRAAAYQAAAQEALGLSGGSSSRAPKAEGGRGGTKDDTAASATEQPAVATGAASSAAPGDAAAGSAAPAAAGSAAPAAAGSAAPGS